jgi:hypothetical protein
METFTAELAEHFVLLFIAFGQAMRIRVCGSSIDAGPTPLPGAPTYRCASGFSSLRSRRIMR